MDRAVYVDRREMEIPDQSCQYVEESGEGARNFEDMALKSGKISPSNGTLTNRGSSRTRGAMQSDNSKSVLGVFQQYHHVCSLGS